MWPDHFLFKIKLSRTLRLDLAAVTEQPDAASAASVARRVNRPIEIANARTATGQSFALPNGTAMREESLTPQRARRSDGTWAPIDTTLMTTPDGSLRPANTPLQMVLSGGGTTPLMSMVDDKGHELSLSWAHPLPAPSVSGNVATYAEVLPGVDLQVSADTTGPRKVLVVKNRDAAANPDLAEIPLTLRTKGVQVTVGPSNNLIAKDQAGNPIFVTPPLTMWDATPGQPVPAEDRSGFGEQASADWQPTSAGKTANVGVRLTGDQLVLMPDKSLLADPGAQYPIRIDPQWHSVSHAFWLLINSSEPNLTAWNGGTRNGDPEGDVATGRLLYNGVQTNYRSFVFFDIPTILTKQIVRAELQLTMSHSWSWACEEADFPFDVHAETGVNESTTWNNQNVWGALLTSTTLTYGNDNASANCRNDTDVSFDVTGRIQTFAAANTTNRIGFGLKARNETCVIRNGETHCPGWRRFRDDGEAVGGGAPIRLRVYYNDPPAQPAEFQIDGKTCDGGTVNLGAATDYSLQATLSDPNADELDGQLDVLQSGTVVHSQTSGKVSSGTRVTWRVASSVLESGKTYTVRAKTTDSYLDSPWTTGCTIKVDKIVPAAPNVASTDYPAGDVQYGSVGKTGMFTLTTTSADVVAYRYGLVDPPTTEVTPAAVGGSVTLPVTPPHDGPVTFYAQAVDGVGNLSTVTQYVFSVKPGTGPIGHWKLDENEGCAAGDTADLTNPSDVNYPASCVGSPVWATDSVDAKLGHETYAHFDGYSRYVTSTPVLDTTTAYTVTAWVRMATRPDGNRSIVSQNGELAAASNLQYDWWADRWRFSILPEPTAISTYGASSAVAPRWGVWTHLAGVYDPMTKMAYLYVDGVLSGTASIPSTSPTGVFSIGQNVWPAGTPPVGYYGSGWEGEIDDVRAYDRAVQASEFIGFVKRVEGWYGFHDGSTSVVADRSPNSRAGVLSGAAAITTGFDGNGLTLNGTQGEATMPGPVAHTDGSFSVSAWVRLIADDADQTAVSQDGTHTSGFVLQYNSATRRWSFGLPSEDTDTPATIARAESFAPPKLGDWTHLTGTYDTTTKKIQIWVNGVLEGTATVNGHWAASGSLVIGRGQSAGAAANRWYGDVDEVMVHTGALAGQEIAVLSDMTRRVPAAQHIAGDFTGDGMSDTVIIHGYPNKVMKLWALTNSGGGNLETPVEVWNSEFAPWEMPTGWQHDGAKWLAADFNGDGKTDIAVLLRDDYYNATTERWIRNSDLWVFYANGAGFNEPALVWDSGTDGAWSADLLKIDAGDVNGDDMDDVVLLREDSTTHYQTFVLISTTSGFGAPAQWRDSGTSPANPRRITMRVGDVNGDGLADFVRATQYDNDLVRLWVNYSDGTKFNAAVQHWVSGTDGYAMGRVKMVVADVTGDGKADVVNYYDDGTSKKILVFASTGQQTFAEPATWADTTSCTGCADAVGQWASTGIAAGDFDGDSRLDLVILRTIPDSKVIQVYTVRSTGTGLEPPVLRYTSGADGL